MVPGTTKMKISLKTSQNQRICLHVPNSATIEILKQEISATLPSKPSKDAQIIQHENDILSNSKPLSLLNCPNKTVTLENILFKLTVDFSLPTCI
jgi:hypothetical protein